MKSVVEFKRRGVTDMAAAAWIVEVDGTEIGELLRDQEESYYFDYSEGDATYFENGLTIQKAKQACIKYLKKIGEVNP